MAAYQSGDMTAFEQLYAALAPPLTRFLRAQARDRAEDLLQETFLQLHRARASYEPGRPVRPWAFAIARNVVLMSRRSWARRSRNEVLAEGEFPEIPVFGDEEGVADRQAMTRALRGIGTLRRDALILHHLVGLTFEEVGAVLGCSTGAAKVRAHRAMSDLRRHFGLDES